MAPDVIADDLFWQRSDTCQQARQGQGLFSDLFPIGGKYKSLRLRYRPFEIFGPVPNMQGETGSYRKPTRLFAGLFGRRQQRSLCGFEILQ